MKTLLLMRHAKSSRDDSSIDDFDRPLNARGRKAAPRMGRLLFDKGLTPDRILASSALRTLETARAVAEACDFRGPVTALDSLYLAAPAAFAAALVHLPEDVIRPLVVGHNPGTEDLLAQLTGEQQPVPTGALAVIDVEIDHWSDFRPSIPGTLRQLWRPRELD